MAEGINATDRQLLPVITFDLDGVLTDPNHAFIPFAQRTRNTYMKRMDATPYEFNWGVYRLLTELYPKYRLYILTSRAFTHAQYSVKLTPLPDYVDGYFVAVSTLEKLRISAALKAIAHIDDSPEAHAHPYFDNVFTIENSNMQYLPPPYNRKDIKYKSVLDPELWRAVEQRQRDLATGSLVVADE